MFLRLPSAISKFIVIGRPQLIALSMLIIFAAHAAYWIERRPLSSEEQDHIWAGRQQLERKAIPKVHGHSPLPNAAAAAGVSFAPQRVKPGLYQREEIEREIKQIRWRARAPFLVFAILLGVSLWYVARRLYGNPGGYVALSLYIFSPAMVLSAATVNLAAPSMWGVFGIIFTGIAISHNLYAPIKKWCYRTVLFSVAAGIAVGSHPATVVFLPVAFLFMLYLAPGRRVATVAVIAFVCAMGATMVYLMYDGSPRAMMQGVDLREWLLYRPAEARGYFMSSSENFLLRFAPGATILLVTALAVFAVWKRTRYFGNSAPLIAGIGSLYLAFITPLAPLASLWALPFLFVFTGGIFADLLETRYCKWVAAVLVLFTLENAWFSWWMMSQVKL